MSDKIFAKKQIQFDEEAYNWKKIVSDTFCISEVRMLWRVTSKEVKSDRRNNSCRARSLFGDSRKSFEKGDARVPCGFSCDDQTVRI